MKRTRSSLGISFSIAKPLQITEVARNAGIRVEETRLYGQYKAKISLGFVERLKNKPDGKLICVTGMTPTERGEGKTCTAIGLAQALGSQKKKIALCLCEPSLGNVLSGKTGTGSGYAQVLPADDINFHFNGDIPAVEAATNLLAAVIDNHRHHGNALAIDPETVMWRRTLDMNDRRLRSSFDLTAAGEMMAILSLSRSMNDLRERLSAIVVALSDSGTPVTAKDLKAVGAMTALLRDAIEPNLVQTLEGQPCFIHSGPFEGLSHGSPSVLATRMALKTADYVVTECGYGTDLGLQKLFDIAAPAGGFEPSTAVIVVTLRALRAQSDKARPEGGLQNLEKHVENVRRYGLEPVVAINRFPEDEEREIERVTDYLRMKKIECAVSNAVADGGHGAAPLAQAVLKTLNRKDTAFKPLTDPSASVEEKLAAIATRIYGADGVDFTADAKRDLELIRRLGFDRLPVNVAKTPFSLSDDPSKRGAPSGWRLRIDALRPYAGAGYIFAASGKNSAMPGLPAAPLLERIDLDETGRITGIHA